MTWEGYTTEGWKKLLHCVATLEKRYAVSISWKEKFGRLRLNPQVPLDALSDADEEEVLNFCSAIELASGQVCQRCGVQGIMHFHRMPTDRWFMTLCDECVRARVQYVIKKAIDSCATSRLQCKGPHYVADTLRYMFNLHFESYEPLLAILVETEPQLSAILKQEKYSGFYCTALHQTPMDDTMASSLVINAYIKHWKSILNAFQKLLPMMIP